MILRYSTKYTLLRGTGSSFFPLKDMMGWWPFKSSNGDNNLKLDSEAKSHYDQVLNSVKLNQPNPGLSSAAQPTKNHTVSIPTFARGGVERHAKSLKQIAMDNCVEFENAYSKCLVNGSYFERIASCQPQQTMHEQCKNMQIQALEMLGYAQAEDNYKKQAIKALADDLMIKAVPTLNISEAQVTEFERLVSAALVKSK